MTMNSKLIQWYTAKLIKDASEKFEFINKPYKAINTEVFDICEELENYMSANYHSSPSNEFTKDWLSFTDNVFKMQLFVINHPKASEQELKDKSMELFGAEIVKNGCAVDIEIYNKLQWLIDYCEPIYPLFNEISCLVNSNNIEPNLEILLHEIIEMKGLNNYNYVNSKPVVSTNKTELQEA